MKGGRVRQIGLDISKINTQSDRIGAFARTFFSKSNEPVAIEFGDPQPAQSVREKGEARGLRSPDGLAHLL